MENAKKYFDRYGKLKRTYEALTEYVQETGEEVEHLRSVVNALDLAQDEADLSQIREELVQSGYIRHKGNKKKEKIVSKPLHFISSDGFDMYVGKIISRMRRSHSRWHRAVTGGSMQKECPALM